MCGHVHLSQYLCKLLHLPEEGLSYMTRIFPWRNWHEKRVRALNFLPLADTCENDASLYRVLLERVGVYMEDVTEYATNVGKWLDPSRRSEAYWPDQNWFSFANLESLQVIKQALPEPYSMLPMSVRFQNAMSLSFGLVFDSECFLQAVGVNRVDRVVAEMESLEGRNAVHFVAMQLHNIIEMDPPATFVRELVAAGADLHKQDRFGRTPLQCYIGQQGLFPNWTLTSTWIKLLHSAGVDLVSYGEKESNLWRSHRVDVLFDDEDATLTALQLIFGPLPRDWDVLLSETNVTSFFEYTPPPASWPISFSHGLLPTTICWRPDENETPSLHWTAAQEIEHLPRTYLAGAYHSTHTGELSRWQKTQDDTGALALAMSTRPSQTGPRYSCRSQPPLGRSCSHAKTYRQSYSYFRVPENRVGGYDWLWEYEVHSSHVCEFGQGQKLVCMQQQTQMSLARCVQYDGDKSLLTMALNRQDDTRKTTAVYETGKG